jgi:tRNA(Ile)-lysidine synthase
VSDPLVSRVAAHCARHHLLPSGATVLALVSGGADSVCLLHVLDRIHDGQLAVLTVDHGLRPGSLEEARGVLRLAAALGRPGHLRRLSLERGPALQERARTGRLAAAREVAAQIGAAVVATGHTASDQAETVLFRLARGTGRTGALGMAPRDGILVRPLLPLTREETRSWCAARGIPVVDDPSNTDRAFARVRVRHQLLPALAEVHPGAERHVALFAERLRDEAVLIDELVDAAWTRCLDPPGLRADALAAERPALRPLLVRRLVEAAGLPGEALSAAAVEQVLGLLSGRRRAEIPGGLALLERGRIVVEPPAGPPPPPRALPVPGLARFGASVVRAARGPALEPRPDRVAVAVGGPLVVRAPRPGDRVPLPGGGRQAVGRLLAARGVPARRRAHVPVVACGERVVWVAGHRADPGLLAAPGREAVVLSLETP